MSERPSPFCPDYCLMQGLCGECYHLQDKVFKNPEDVEIKKTSKTWGKAQIIGRTGNNLYVSEDGRISTVSVNTKLIK